MAPWEKLAERFHHSVRPKADRRVGIEIERIAMWRDGYALHYRPGKSTNGEARPGAEDLLNALHQRHDWEAVRSPEGKPLGFHTPLGKVSLEPGSQVEFSGDPVADLDGMVDQVEEFEGYVTEVTNSWGLKWVGIGLNPLHAPDQLDVIPSPRYHIMTDYLGRRDTLGLHMMRLTSSIQLNLDYTSEAEAIEMLRASLAAAPVSYALFGNSPLKAGKPSGHLSYRGEVWRHTDPDRGGLLPEAFESDFNFVRYAELAWKRPLMFAQAPDLHYVPANGRSLADITAGKLEGVEPDARNYTNSIQEIFTEARIKPGYIEVRSMDGLNRADRYAAAAFWLGLLYSENARRQIIAKVGKLDAKTREQLWVAAGRDGMQAKVEGVDLAGIVRDTVATARQSLVDRKLGEEKYLAPIEETLRTGKNPGARVLEHFHATKGDIAGLVDFLTI